MTSVEDSFQQYLSTCPLCEGVIDVTQFEPFSQVVCPHCSEPVRVRQKFDHFTIEKQLGEGGMSRVFDALDSTLGRHVALKILNRSYSRDSVRMASFEREAQLTASVTHPNVVKLYSVGRDQANFYIAMELVSGGSLEDRITKFGKISELEVLRVGRCIAEGLRAAAREGLIHRDIKPANILFTENDTPKLADFGLAVFHGRDKDDSGEIWATPHYVPPEKLNEDVEDFRSDMYSLGATLYHALTGKPPYEANTNSIQELKVIKSVPVKLEDRKMSFSSRTCELIDRLIKLDPEARFQSYDQLIDAFRYAEGLLGYSELGQKTRKAKKITFFASAAILTVLLAILLRPSANPPTENATTEEVHEGAGVTLEAGKESVADQFLRARQLLVSGKTNQAKNLFQQIIQSSETKQPTLNWARFNAALASMLLQDKKQAQNHFNDIQTQADAGAEVSSRSFKGFFAKVGARMSQDLGLKVLDPTGAYQRDNEELLGYLAQGIAHWQFGDAGKALDWFSIFQSTTAPAGLEWIENYKTMIQPMIDDDRRLQASGLLTMSTNVATSREAVALDAQIKALISKLKTKGVYYQNLAQKSRELQKATQELKGKEVTQETTRKKALLERESAQFHDLMQTLPSMVRGYDYSHVLDLVQNLGFESQQVLDRKAAKVYAYTQAQAFVDQLMKDVNQLSYSGQLLVKDRSPIQGQVIKMTHIQTTVAFARGQVLIPTGAILPENLIEIAQVYLDQERDSTAYYKRLESMMVFAKLHQLKDRSEVLLTQLMSENSDFKKRWSKVEAFDK